MSVSSSASRSAASEEILQIRISSDATLAFLLDHHIPATPSNYSIFYNYFSPAGEPDLKRDISVLIESGTKFTPAVCETLSAKHLDMAAEMRALQTASHSIELELGKVLVNLRKAGDDTTQFGDRLGQYSDSFSGASNLGALEGSLKLLVEKLLSETRDMEERSRSLENKLLSSSQEVLKLRQNLEVVRAESMTDSLTGIGNRKFFEASFQEIVVATNPSSPIALILGDIDHFKNFNDNWGHQMGDQVLRIVSQCMKQQFGAQAKLARYGGEEFVVILPDTDLEAAMMAADEARRVVSSQKMKKKSTGELIGRITMSFGTAIMRTDESLSELVRRADDALYAAKNAGRNMVMSDAMLTKQKALAS